jgi:hypothetical protein
VSDHKCLDCGSLNVVPYKEAHAPAKYVGGRVPYGFFMTEGWLRFEPFINGPNLVWIMRMHAAGNSYRALATYMNAQEVKGPAGGEWSHSSVRRVVENGKKLSHLIPIEQTLA